MAHRAAAAAVALLAGAAAYAQEAPPPPAPQPAPAAAAPEIPKKRPPRVRPAPPDPFRFLHYQEVRPGQALDAIVIRIDPTGSEREVRYLGQVHRDHDPVPAALKDMLVRTLRETEVWPYWDDGEERGCIAFGHGPVTREARLGHRHNEDPAMERFLAVVNLESLQMAYAGELLRYASDEPSLAVGTIDMLLTDVAARRIVVDQRIVGALRRIATDRTVRALVRDAATRALDRLGQGPGPEAAPAPVASTPKTPAPEPEMSD